MYTQKPLRNRSNRVIGGIASILATSALAITSAMGASAAPTQSPSNLREGVRPVVTDAAPVTPVSGANAQEQFRAKTSQDRKIMLPHPPIDQIPFMPMPEPTPVGVANIGGGESSMTFHDAITGETKQLALNVSNENALGGQSVEGDYPGFGNMIDNYDETLESFGSMSLASSLDSFPRSGNVKLIMRFTDTGGVQRWFACSGSMQDPGVVLCAAHCVYARTPNGLVINDWADIIYVYPAWDGDSNNGPFGQPDGDEVIENFGYAFGTAFLAGTNYINSGDSDADCGLIRFTRGSSRNIGMLTGWFAWAWGQGCATIQSRTYNNFSYPSENCPTAGLHNGRDLYFWSGSIDACPNNQMQLNTGGNCLDTVWGGMSGSGMYYIDGDNRYVHSVCSTSNRNDRGYYCKLWETFTNDMVNFENTTRGNTFDLEALRFRAGGSTTITAGQSLDSSALVAMVNATNANPASDSYTLRVYLSTNNNISSGDTLLATWNYTVDFAAMQSINFSVPAPVIPIDTPSGTYWIGVELDTGADTVSTNNDTDTWDAQQITVIAAVPDLEATLCNATAGIYYQGESVFVTHRTFNFGTRPTNDVRVEFRASTNNIISTGDRFMEERFYGALPVGSSVFVNSIVRIPTDLPAGTYFIGTRVDESTGTETNLANNWVSDIDTITVRVCIPDLTRDGILNFFDVSAFLNAFSAHNPIADFNNDGVFNFFDVSAFLGAFSAGCP